ncbi:MAG: hypothetical protein F9K13_10005 [Candidatus Methylomirabilis oxygeniifera]|uniref:Ferredoxin--nitrite reductase n=1 Tax=Methylomirabilis oxygeniifera TaxID=671143 RepID=D5MG89_METO1|nr:MAG: hypothetical protein F9K13_10005 [Candidatus Methylomirabilis oxyfera]CBE68770.1 protein of unknown function [Candidatus Methylomirabilis oxyfera]
MQVGRELRKRIPRHLSIFTSRSFQEFCGARCLEVVQALTEKLPGVRPITVHWSGCPAGCGNHQGANIGLQGTKIRINGKTVEAVHIYVGERSGPKPQIGQMIMADVPYSELSHVMEGLVQFYPRKRPT